MKGIKKKILVIDDQVSTRKLLSKFLGDEFEIVEKSNGLEALTSIEEGLEPDAVVCDLLMPEINGRDFLIKTQQNGKRQIPVLVLTSMESSVQKMTCLQLGARDYMVKPFNPNELKIRLQNMIQFQ